MAARIKVPDSAVRTREVILAGELVLRGCVWTRCWNCGGSGNYPSGMIPSGLCRLYCWAKPHTDPIAAALGALPPFKSADDPTYGRLAMPVEKFVKKQQANDRREYRAAVTFELERPAREAAAIANAARIAEETRLRELEQAETEAWEMDRARISQFVGRVGERVELPLRVVDRRRFENGNFGPRYLVRLRDESGNVLVWWTASPVIGVGESIVARATVKEHSVYGGEKQTVVSRLAVVAPVAS